MKTSQVILGAGLGIMGVWLLTRVVRGTTGITLKPGVYTGPLQYVGSTKLLKYALGECWDVISTVDIWDPDTGEFVPPVDAANYTIVKGTLCYVQVRESCTLYNFKFVE